MRYRALAGRSNPAPTIILSGVDKIGPTFEISEVTKPGALLKNLRRVERKLYGDFAFRVEVGLIHDPKDDIPVILAHPMAKDQAWVIS